ncbi:hypothetical protein [Stenotrophomonas sp. AS1]|uniref:hypothetical protein n=1 Tax=Stenotrophomonas sp. AS1 TaxID=3029188 RepID=UPI003B82887D
MSDKVSVVFHEVFNCGYYKHGATAPSFGGLAELLLDLETWSAGKSLANTQISSSAAGHSLPIYLLSMESFNGAVLLTMWNEVPATADNQVTSVAANDLVGSVTQHMNGIVQGTIPGFPTYFLFLPNVGAFATLRVEGLITAQPPFQKYCEQFLATQSSYCVQLPPNPSSPAAVVTYGYRPTPRDQVEAKVRPRFRTRLFSKPAITAEIIRRWDDVYKIERRADITFKTPDERALWQKALGVMKKGWAPSSTPNKAHVTTSLTTSLTRAEVVSLINDWSQQAQTTDWDDYGFKFKGETSTHWLSKSGARGEVVLNGIRAADGTVATSALLRAIMGHQSYLTGLLT